MPQTTKRYIAGRLYQLDPGEISLDGTQPRKYFDEQAMTELKTSIQKHGVLQPVLVRAGEHGGLLLVSGERRYQASVAAGLATIPAIFTKGDPMEVAIVENLLREGLTAIEEAEAIDRLRSAHNYQLSDLSQVLGKAESTLCEILSLNRLPAGVKEECRNDPKAARGILAEIAKQRTETRMLDLYDKYKARGLTRGEIRSTKSNLKTAALEAAAEAAAKGTDAVDLAFIEKFSGRLDGVEVEKLERPQAETMLAALDALRVVVNRKLRTLKGLPKEA